MKLFVPGQVESHLFLVLSDGLSAAKIAENVLIFLIKIIKNLVFFYELQIINKK